MMIVKKKVETRLIRQSTPEAMVVRIMLLVGMEVRGLTCGISNWKT